MPFFQQIDKRADALSWARGLLEEAAAARHRARPEPRRRFVIFASGRSGSTLLTSLLDSHPEIRCDDEILNFPRLCPELYVSNRARAASEACYGFHVKGTQLSGLQRRDDWRSFLEGFSGRGWVIVRLWRENVLNQSFSNIYARWRGRWHDRADPAGEGPRPGAERLLIDPASFIRRMEKRDERLRRERAAVARIPHIELQYERDLAPEAAREASLGPILAALGVEPRPLKSDLRKSVSRPLSDLVENYAELEEAVRGSPFARFLPEAPAERSETRAS